MINVPSRRVHEVFVIDGVGNGSVFEPKANLTEYALEQISGTVQAGSASGFYSLSNPQAFTDPSAPQWRDASAWKGEWVGLFSNAGAVSRLDELRFVIGSDYFGFGKIHYSVVPSKAYPGAKTVVAGPSFRGVAHTLEQLGYSAEIRWDVALPQIVSHVNLFRTRSSRKTFSDLIEVTAQREALLVSKSGFCIISSPEPEFSDTYEALIEAGCNAALADISSAEDLELPRSISLSGGKDSRALFSMIASGGSAREWNVITRRPSSQASASMDIFRRDLEYATLIVDKFDLDWHTAASGFYVEASFDETLAEHQDFRSNQSYEISPQRRLRRGANEVTTMGIGGELLRSYIGGAYRDGYPSWWAESSGTAESSSDDLRLLFRKLVNPWKLPSELYNRAEASFVRGLQFDMNGSALNHIDESYTQYRNRAYSANMELSRHAGTYLTYPLAQPEFVAASKLLPDDDRDDGRVLFDIIERADPDLNVLPFAAPSWPTRFVSRGSKSVWDTASFERANARFDQLASSATQVQTVHRKNVSGDFQSDASLQIGNRLKFLRGFINEDWFDPLIERAARRSLVNSSSLFSLLGVIESLSDAAAPPKVATNCLHVDLSMSSIRLVASSAVFDFPVGSSPISPATSISRHTEGQDSFSDMVASIDLSHVEAQLIHDSSRSFAEVRIEHLPEGCEVAIYLYSQGVRVTRTPYAQALRFDFSEHGGGAPLDRAMIFLRWKGDPEATRVFNVGVAP